MALIGSTRIGLRDITQSVNVPDDPKAHLMYYLDCIYTVIDIDDSYQIQRLRNFANYRNLTDDETDKLVLMCFMVSPDELENKCIFQSDALCDDYGNKFFKLSAVRNHLLVSNSIIIGGQRKQVKKIMTYKMFWINTYYFEPMRYFDGRLRRVMGLQRQNNCVIL